MKKMVHLMHSDGLGGGPVVVNQMIRDFSPTFVVSAIVGGKGKVTDACQKMGLQAHSIAIDRLWKCPFGFFQLFFLLRKIKPHVLFLHGQWAAPLGALAGKIAGIPVMIYVAHSPAFYHRQNLRNAIRAYICEFIPCQLSSAVVALSEGNRYQYMIRRWVDEKKLHLIHNGQDQDLNRSKENGQTREKIRKLWFWDPWRRHVLFLGRLDHQKGLIWLVKAWQIVSKNYPEADLWVVGSGPQEKEIKDLAMNLKLGPSCHFLPDQADGREFIEASDFVVLPSLYEGHALVPLETMAAGKAFVGTKVDGIVDSVRDEQEGLLVAPGGVQGLAIALGRLINNPDLCEKLGNQGLQRIKIFDWKLSFLRYEALVESLLKGESK